MTESVEHPVPPPPSPEAVAKAERAKRLAAALRENLRRRKAAPRTAVEKPVRDRN